MNALATAPGVIATPGKYYIGAQEVMEYLDCKENNILIVGEEWTGDGIDFCGIEESVFKVLELQLNNMIMAMKATMEVLK